MARDDRVVTVSAGRAVTVSVRVAPWFSRNDIPCMPDLIQTLAELNIPYERFDHVPVFTCDEAYAALPNNPAVQTKNIFLRDKRGRRHLLLVTTCALKHRAE